MKNTEKKPSRLLRLPSVLERIPLTKSEISRRVRTGDFPKPVSIGIRAVAWLESDIDQYIEKLVNSSRESSSFGKSVVAQEIQSRPAHAGISPLKVQIQAVPFREGSMDHLSIPSLMGNVRKLPSGEIV